MSVYADTSFLVSLYALDANSDAAVRVMRRLKTPLVLTPFGEAELTNALELRVFRRDMTRAQADAAFGAVQADIRGGVYSLDSMPQAVYEEAARLSRKRTAALGSRTVDVVHDATALLLHATRFLTFGAAQKRLAAAEGVPVV